MTFLRMPNTKERKTRADLLAMLDDGPVAVTVDTLARGVDIPGHLMNSPLVRLDLSRRFTGEIRVELLKVKAVLTFGSFSYTCVIPLASIVEMRSLA